MSNYKVLIDSSFENTICDENNICDENYEDECIICFELCKDKIYYFCKNCNHKFHTHCFLNWKNKCKELKHSYKKCCYCQKKSSIHKRCKFWCFYFNDKL